MKIALILSFILFVYICITYLLLLIFEQTLPPDADIPTWLQYLSFPILIFTMPWLNLLDTLALTQGELWRLPTFLGAIFLVVIYSFLMIIIAFIFSKILR